MRYKKSQIGWIVPALFAPIILFLYLAYANQWGNNPLPLVPFVMLAGLFVIIIPLFYKLTITLDVSVLRLTYGIGLITIKFKIDKLLETSIIKTPWYYGLGIRITPKGMLYNIQGLRAVEIKYVSNGKSKSVMIGTSEPERLKEVLDNSFAEKH